MHLTLSPQMGLPGQPETIIEVAGDVLTIDGVPYDLSPVPEGGDGEWTEDSGEGSPSIGCIRRTGGVIHATVRVRLGETAADNQPDSPWTIPDAEGTVTIPAARRPEPEETM